eukprot:Opistho-2@13447
MTVGKDVSSLFPDVVNCMQTDNLELKKLVYLYLMNYAKSQPDLAILAVNTFVKVRLRCCSHCQWWIRFVFCKFEVEPNFRCGVTWERNVAEHVTDNLPYSFVSWFCFFSSHVLCVDT